MRPLALLLAALTLPGCALMNTLQTADVLGPGGVVLGVGYTAGASGDVIEHYDPDRRDVPFAQPELLARVGVVPGVEVSARLAGASTYGVALKGGFAQGPVMVAANAGFGQGEEGICFYGCVTESVHTRYGALLVGTDAVPLFHQLYGAAKLTDYRYRREAGGEVTAFERVIPGFALGAVGHAQGRAAPILEVNTYFMPHVAFTVGGGLLIRLR